jgi:putative MATE family efflux protein
MQQRGAVLDDSRPLWRTLLVFLVPLMLSNILQAASGTITSIYLGRMIGVGALAAASSVFPILFLLLSFFVGIASASSVLIGQAYGARDPERLERTAGTALSFAVLIGIAIGLLGAVLSEPLLALIGTPPDIFVEATTYARIMFFTLPLLFVYLEYSTFLRGVGDARTPLVVLIAAIAVAAALTPVLIPLLGIAAAPISNAFSNALGTAGLLVWLDLRANPLALSKILRYCRIDWRILGLLIKIGIPTGVQLVMVSLSEIAVLSFVNRFGSHATAPGSASTTRSAAC